MTVENGGMAEGRKGKKKFFYMFLAATNIYSMFGKRLLAVGCCAWALALGGCGKTPVEEPAPQKTTGMAVRRTFSSRRVSVKGEPAQSAVAGHKNLTAGGEVPTAQRGGL
jgi:hypothetical protein